MAKYVMALDAGTSSNRCILFDHSGAPAFISQKEFKQYYPQPGWVEHDALEIWESMKSVMQDAMKKTGAKPEDIASIGITNQRETTVVWDRKTGRPVCPAIVWQCRRTAAYCDELKEKGLTEMIRQKTGLLIDAYFSGSKLHWILENISNIVEKAKNGDIIFGTIDTWLIWNLTGGKVHVTDYSNASRTMMFNIHTLDWDEDILKELGVPKAMLPKPMPSSCVYGETEPSLLGKAVKIAGAAGDQQAALFGQGCYRPGEAKNTYGTGCFLLMNTGQQPKFSKNGLLTTIAWGLDGKVEYALEGSVFVSGAAIQWLRDEMGLITASPESEAAAASVPDTHGCYVVPAFTGLGAPYWDPYARGCILGLTRGVTKNHVIRATLESIAFQTADVLEAMRQDSETDLKMLKVDGGASANSFLMQTQADLIDCTVRRPKCVETTALGAAYLAGLAAGFWKDKEEILKNSAVDRDFEPAMEEEERKKKLHMWQKAVKCSLGWAKD